MSNKFFEYTINQFKNQFDICTFGQLANDLFVITQSVFADRKVKS